MIELSVFKAIKERHSLRAYSDKKVEKEKIEKVLLAGSYAPSAVNSQPWRFYIAESNKAREKVMDSMFSGNAWAKHAPVLIVVLADLRNAHRKKQKNYKLDIGLCLENMMLEAVELGLGSCACAAFDKEKLSADLELPEHIEPLIVLPLGYKARGEEFNALQENYGNLKRAQHKKGGRMNLNKLVYKRE